jgi:alpha-tubulin suppressor-like RCC1 family protein
MKDFMARRILVDFEWTSTLISWGSLVMHSGNSGWCFFDCRGRIGLPIFSQPIMKSPTVSLLVLLALAMPLPGATVTADFNSGATVPVTANGYTATGNDLNLSLSFAPPTGTHLTVVNNTGAAAISGRFSNLGQGQTVVLPYQTASYQFVADYYGGTGNDLVLQWAGAKAGAWGYNFYGQLGNNGAGQRDVPVDLSRAGVLAGRTVIAASLGEQHSLALCADGTLAAWGDNANGQLGNGTTTASRVPVAVTTTGVLAGKTITAIAAGNSHSFALCADGTLAAWGYNPFRQLGNGLNANALSPVAITNSGVLAGKRVTAIAAGFNFSLALCADGTLVSWGDNFFSQLGNGGVAGTLPGAIQMKGVLAGKTVTAIAAGGDFALALCADGTLAAWGSNTNGQHGNGTTVASNIPVAVTTTGALAGKTITAIAAGVAHCLALGADGSVFAWGYNSSGQVGDGSTTDVMTPVEITTAGVLAGRTVTAVMAGFSHSLALGADGRLAAWGNGDLGQLGNGKHSGGTVPVFIENGALGSGDRLTTLAPGCAAQHTIALAAAPLSGNAALATLSVTPGNFAPDFASGVPAYQVRVAHAATSLTVKPTVAESHAKVTVNGTAVVSGSSSPSIPRAAGATTINIGVTAQDGTTGTYTLQVVDDSALAGLGVSGGVLRPAFSANCTEYTLDLPSATTTIRLTPTARDLTAAVTVNGVVVPAGSASSPLPLDPGPNSISVAVTALDGSRSTYTITAVRLVPLEAAFVTPDTLPVRAANYTAAGNTVNLSLGYAPATGARLTVIDNPGDGFITGTFANLAQGQTVELSYQGARYRFVANYFGGTGNDLVLQWAGTKAYAWGDNGVGQLGVGSLGNRTTPAAVTTSGVLAGKTITALAAGNTHSLALCADGTLAAWGYNLDGQLGNGTTTNSSLPVAVQTTGVLAGKTIIAIAAGYDFSVAACADGTLAAWGSNRYGQLGNGGTVSSSVPVAVNTSGVLAGKVVVAVAAGYYFSLALTADGTVAGWGGPYNSGALGHDRYETSLVPVAVNTDGFLAGRRVVGIGAGAYHSIALCADGSLATWGSNNYYALGFNTKITAHCLPHAVSASGVLAGKTVTALGAGGAHFLALCATGELTAWGGDFYGQLGNGITDFGFGEPLAVTSGILAGKSIAALSAGDGHSLTLCRDGTLAAWGYNASGQLGNGGTTDRLVPVAVTTSALGSGEKIIALAPGCAASHTLALAAVPISGNSTLASLTLGAGTLNAAFSPGTTSYTARLARGITSVTVTPTVADTAATVTVNGVAVASGTASQALSLTPENPTVTVVVTAQNGSSTSYRVTFTDDATLAGLALSTGTLSPAFAGGTFAYAATVPAVTADLRITPTAADPAVAIRVNGSPVGSGVASEPLPLGFGINPLSVIVTALDGTTATYTISVNRLSPIDFTFTSASSVLATATSYSATGKTLNLSLGFAPETGTNLTAINNTGLAFIVGRFEGLAQGQLVRLMYNNVAYDFVANYFGGTGNDLVLGWAKTKAYAWGSNQSGRLGNGGTANSNVPLAVTNSGVLANKTILALAAGGTHSLALCGDGTLAAWGTNSTGQLGTGGIVASSVPVAVNRSAALVGKTVIAIAAGSSHSLALCADGTVCAWGYNGTGQLGNGSTSTSTSTVPVAVSTTGVLAGKTVIAIAAGDAHSLALCSDGSVVTWGDNFYGALGNNSTVSYSSVPVAVTAAGTLAEKTVTAVAAGSAHCVALTSTGTLAAWGRNANGQLGNNATINTKVPVAVSTTGLLAGKKASIAAAGSLHNLVRCADGTLGAWGYNSAGQLGNGGTANSSVPVAVTTSAVLAGKTVIALVGASSHSLALAVDGTLAAWGSNTSGRLGDGTSANSNVPVTVATAGLGAGEKFTALAVGCAASHSMAIAAVPLSGDSSLAGLTLTNGTLSSAFAAGTTAYLAAVPPGTPSLTVTPTAADGDATIQVNGTPVASGAASAAIACTPLPTTISVAVTAPNGIASTTYTITIDNHAPTFAGYSVSTPYQTPVALALAKVRAKAADADGDPLVVSGVGPSANGGIVVLQATTVSYTPPAGFAGTDTFPIILRDARGATATGTISVAVGQAAPSGLGANRPTLALLPDGKMEVSFQGIPGRSYRIQRSAGDLDHWTALATLTAGPSGKVSFPDDAPPPGSAFYRLAMP